MGRGGVGGGGKRDEDGAGPWVKTVSWSGCRTGDGFECLYGERGKCGRCEPRRETEGVSLSECVSKLGSEATVGSLLDIRCLLLCKCDNGELCDKCPLRG